LRAVRRTIVTKFWISQLFETTQVQLDTPVPGRQILPSLLKRRSAEGRFKRPDAISLALLRNCHGLSLTGRPARPVSHLGPDDVVTVGKYAIRNQSEHFNRSVASKDQSNYWTISPGDFVYDPMSAYYGALGRYEGAQDGIVSPAYRVIRLTSDVDPGFMVHLLRSHHIRFQLERRSSQGNKEGKRRLLQRDEFSGIEFNLPPIEVQQDISQKLALFRRDVSATEQEIDALTRQKRGLMQKLLTGEWRVKVDSEKESAA
jgi:hypothetical protein